ncbi:MAG: D-alanyl-D-alanine carboxypeptidase/D-alanyl-D-alanine-endopeptidase [Melioribacteraceae bacterium]|nr:D-alanyl-D-alanine carboxypeptidase/D-alanyl-D-alanine-endopeptidase [Melioribacteraceae bacterium]
MYLKKIISLLLFLSVSAIFGQVDSLKEAQKVEVRYNRDELRKELDKIFSDPSFNNSFWGVMVKSLKTGETIYRRNSEKLMHPASNIKLFTTAAAYDILGKDFNYETILLTNGRIEKGVLLGDLILKGSGDPTFTNKFCGGDAKKLYELWADTLIAKGVWAIEGNIIGDDRQFDNKKYGKGWNNELNSQWFSAPAGALSFNENIVEIKIAPTKRNFPAVITISPNTSYVVINPKVATVDKESFTDIKITREFNSNVISITGRIKENSNTYTDYVSIDDPTTFSMTILKEVFENKGIKISGGVFTIGGYPKRIQEENLFPLHRHTSISLNSIIKEINKNSNNFFAEQLLRTIGLEIFNLGSAENGIIALRELLDEANISPDDMVMVDGSGISLFNLVSPKQIVALLSYMYNYGNFRDFKESLPIAGIDGTLSDRMANTIAEGKVFAKSGYNTQSSSLCGYIRTEMGELLAFSILLNNYLVPTSLANYIQDNACIKMVNYKRN